jgi:hypothetical protein
MDGLRHDCAYFQTSFFSCSVVKDQTNQIQNDIDDNIITIEGKPLSEKNKSKGNFQEKVLPNVRKQKMEQPIW